MKAGLLLLDKEAGMTSASAIARVKRRLSLERIGHAGTLDPMATGLLVCLIGPATRLASFAQDGDKIYSGTFQFGLKTHSDDITGRVIERTARFPEFSDVLSFLPRFIGEIEQVPPQVSAIKVDGERAYRLARQGQEVELKPRRVKITSFEVFPAEDGKVTFRIACTKGTYIRSIARDLGDLLGCGACLSALRREFTAPFSIENAKKLDDVSSSDILPWDSLFPSTEHIEVSAEEAQRLLGGQQRVLDDISSPARSSGIASERVIYYRQQSKVPLGLLERCKSSWKYAVNIGE